VKELNIKDCIYLCAKAWEDIGPESLSPAWNKILICADQEAKDSDDDVRAVSSNVQIVM